jgi:hypothetical protein
MSFKQIAMAVMDRAPVYNEKSQSVASSAFETKNSGVAFIICNTSSAMQADFFIFF